MLTQLGPMPKAEAISAIAARGFSEHYDTGECGDGGYGSRLYYRRPNAPANRYGAPLEHATASRLGRGWHVAIFENEASDAR